MKRLITILLSLAGCISLFGQNVPMVVAGKVHISGPMRSQGSVNIYAATVDTGRVEVDNTSGALLAADTIVLYSNDTTDGLLRNLNTTTGGGGVQGIAAAANPNKVIVRKTFAAGKYTYFSLPFTAALSSIYKGNSTQSLGTQDVDYQGWSFDAQQRSHFQGATAAVWKVVTATGFAKGMGNQFYYTPGGDVDFVTTNAGEITSLFQNPAKSVTFTTYRDLTSPIIQQGLDQGWVFAGGLNSTNFTLNSANITGSSAIHGSVIYFRNTTNSQATNTQGASLATWHNAVLSAETAYLPPFSPFYLQSDVAAGSATGSFVLNYNPSGLVFNSITFRSANDEAGPQDQLYFALSSDKDGSYDRFYLDFADNYSDDYQVEDAIQMSTSQEESPAVWSLLGDETSPALVVNGLPMQDERVVKMGFSVPEAGDYTISLDKLRQQDLRNVILEDKVTGTTVDLLQFPSYSFSSGTAENENGRFVLYINSSITGTPSIGSGDTYAYVKDNLLTVKNLADGDRVQVLDLTGRTIASGKAAGKEFSVALNQKGVYVVNVQGGKAFKVLNK